MENLIVKEQDELKELKKVFWQHYIETCQAKEEKIKEIKKKKKQMRLDELKEYAKEIFIPAVIFLIVLQGMLTFTFWLWN